MTLFDMQGGMAPGRAHTPALAGSIPAPATIAKTTRGTVMARDGEGDCRPMTRRDRDSRERPATLLPPAAVHPTLPSHLSTAAGGVSVCCGGGLS